MFLWYASRLFLSEEVHHELVGLALLHAQSRLFPSQFYVIKADTKGTQRWYAEDCSRIPELSLLWQIGKNFSAFLVGPAMQYQESLY